MTARTTVSVLLRSAALGCCVLSCCQFAQAQQATELSTIKKQVDQLAHQNRLILKKLNELEEALSNRSETINNRVATTDVHAENFRGAPSASIVLIEYGDFECPFCGQFHHNTFPRILKNYLDTGKVKFSYRDLPLHHAHAMAAARACRCAGEQGKYWEMHDALLESQNNLIDEHRIELADSLHIDRTKFTECLASNRFTAEIQASISEASNLGLNATPAFIIGTLENDGNTLRIEKRILGAVPYEYLKSDLDALLERPPGKP